MGETKGGNLKPLTESTAELEKQACDLRTAGLTYEEIAGSLQLSGKAQAYRIVQRALRRIPAESVLELRQIEAERLEAMTQILWPEVRQGNIKGIHALLKVMERRSRLMGLDVPVSAPPPIEGAPVVSAEVERLIEQAAFFEDLVADGRVVLPERFHEMALQ